MSLWNDHERTIEAIEAEKQTAREAGCDCIEYQLIGLWFCGNGHVHVTLVHSEDCDLEAEQRKKAERIVAARWN